MTPHSGLGFKHFNSLILETREVEKFFHFYWTSKGFL